MAKNPKPAAKKKKDPPPPWELAVGKVLNSPLYKLASHTGIRCGKDYPIAKSDWAYVTSDGYIYLNPWREAGVGEWTYVISHCLLHLGFEHIRENRTGDAAWNAACDLVVTRFLLESRIGTPLLAVSPELPFPVKDEEQAYDRLKEEGIPGCCRQFSTMTNGRPDMVWRGKCDCDYQKLFAESLQESLRDSIRVAGGQKADRRDADSYNRHHTLYEQAREWFISSYPLLGALAASFRLVDDEDTVRRMKIPVAAVSPQLREIYINSRCKLDPEEWKFVLAHEFLHAALRHDVRLEDRDPDLWNEACDYVVNGWLVEMNLGTMPEFALLDQRFKGMSVENVYDIIYEDARRRRQENAAAAGDILYGDGDWWDSLEGEELDHYYRSALQQGLSYGQDQARGFLPAGLVEEIYAVSRPPIRWDVELAKWFDLYFTPLEKHRTYARLSRRQSATPDIPRPAWYRTERPGEARIFGVLLDTSGSMDRGLLAAALGSIASYSEARDVHHVRVVFCDAAPYDQGVMSPEDIAGAVQVRGRGGTKLQPGIDLLDRDPSFPKNAPLLIITDGCCDKLNLRGRNHAYLVPWGFRLPFAPKGPVFRLR